MIRLLRTDSAHHDFVALVRLLDAELAARDGREHSLYAQFNKIDSIKHAVVAYDDGIPAGCGAMKEFDAQSMEIKRMYVLPDERRKGIAAGILLELERWAEELSYRASVLETGKRQPEAIALYTKNGYTSIPNYGQYAGIENSLCFKKNLRQQ